MYVFYYCNAVRGVDMAANGARCAATITALHATDELSSNLYRSVTDSHSEDCHCQCQS